MTWWMAVCASLHVLICMYTSYSVQDFFLEQHIMQYRVIFGMSYVHVHMYFSVTCRMLLFDFQLISSATTSMWCMAISLHANCIYWSVHGTVTQNPHASHILCKMVGRFVCSKFTFNWYLFSIHCISSGHYEIYIQLIIDIWIDLWQKKKNYLYTYNLDLSNQRNKGLGL